MAFADSVPGVSGGTIAYILGVYNKLLSSIADVFSKSSLKEKKEPLLFVVKLGIFWIIGMILAVKLISSQIESNIYGLSSLFIGFVIASIPITVHKEREVLKKNIFHIAYVFLGILIVVLLSGNSSAFGINSDMSIILSSLIYFVGGALGISALLLPGLSGSTVLLILGLYVPIITAVDNFLSGDFNTLKILIPFGLGFVFGGIFISKFLKYLLENHLSKLIFFIEGMLIGSLFAIINGPTTLEVPRKALSLSTFNYFLFAIGILSLIVLNILPKFIADRKNASLKNNG